MSKVWTLLTLAASLLMLASLPAAAEGNQNEWLERTFSAKSESNSGATRRAASVKSRATKTQVASTEDDDGSRPQRRAASKPRPRESLSGSGETGVASYYWQPQALASGGRFNPNALTAAHKTLPFGTRVRVTHMGNGNSVDVVINDRGPYVAGRIIDLSKRAAQDIGMTGQGVARVRVSILGR
jgi:rare lipoprotein A (peptidoglycan hydrolase)